MLSLGVMHLLRRWWDAVANRAKDTRSLAPELLGQGERHKMAMSQ